MQEGLAGDHQALRLSARPRGGRQRAYVTVVDALVALELLLRDRAREERPEVLRVKRRQRPERTRRDMPALVVGARINLLRRVEPPQSILVSRRRGHRADGAGLDLVQDSMVKFGVGIVAHREN